MTDRGPDNGGHNPRESGVGGEDDPRNIGDQNDENSASARGAEVELSPQEREEQIKSAAPDGGEIKDTPSMEEAQRDPGQSESA
ncbi:MAG: hypothetical protein M3Y09_19320, partial [Actinomycetota bacterium]|nr:hypothetical protein [Actinomycetota bacterium]